MKRFLFAALAVALFVQTLPAQGQEDFNKLQKKADAYFEEHKEELLKELRYQVLLRIFIEEFFHGRVPTAKEMFYGSLDGIVGATEDFPSHFLSPEAARVLRENAEGEYGGIGIRITNYPHSLEINEVFEGGPAQKAGLEQGDSIIRIDGVLVQALSQTERAARIRGPLGTTVKLRVIKASTGLSVDVELVREKVRVPDSRVEWRVEDDAVIITLPTFSENTAQELVEIAGEVEKMYPDSPLVLDLRNNGGGLLSSLGKIAALWINPDTVLAVMESRNGGRNFYPSASAVTDRRYTFLGTRRTAVLVNKYTASAAEVLAGALQDYEGDLEIKIIGEKTVGKGSVQMLMNFEIEGESEPAMLILTIQHWLTPNGRSIDGEGIKPDILIERTREDVKAGRDPQMQRALEFAKTGK